MRIALDVEFTPTVSCLACRSAHWLLGPTTTSARIWREWGCADRDCPSHRGADGSRGAVVVAGQGIAA
jgi:hypothetical protein